MRFRTMLTTGVVLLTVFAMLSVHAVFQTKGVQAADMKVPAAVSIHAELTLGEGTCHVQAHGRVISDKILTDESIPIEVLGNQSCIDFLFAPGRAIPSLQAAGCSVHQGPILGGPGNTDFLSAFCPAESGEAALGILNRFAAFGAGGS